MFNILKMLTPFSPFPLLQTERLVLRQMTLADVNEVFDMRSNPEVMKYIGKPRAKSMDDAKDLIQRVTDGLYNQTGITWALSLKESPDLIGSLGLWRTEPENNRAEIGFTLRRQFHRKGYLSEAIKPVLAFGFERMQLNSIMGSADARNLASCRTMEKAGFKCEGILRQNWYFEGNYSDSAIYGLLAEDYQRAQLKDS